jgi:hypothetical protein
MLKIPGSRVSILIKVFLFTLLVGCETTFTGYSYKICAVYEAPQSQFRVTIYSEGYIEAGADTSDTYKGKIKIAPLSQKGKNILLMFQDNNEVSYRIESGRIVNWKWGFRDNQRTLIDILTTSGYTNIDGNEIRASIRAIGGAFGGPKGVILEGQSQPLKVIEIDLS